jgi:antitoxin (DNA-binding transcriptional repressor) of toxin-antitoxin stability system
MITVAKHEFIERISEILDIAVENGETIEITFQSKVIARLAPVSEPKQPAKRDTSEAWKNLKRLSTELSAHWPQNVTTVDAISDARW